MHLVQHEKIVPTRAPDERGPTCACCTTWQVGEGRSVAPEPLLKIAGGREGQGGSARVEQSRARRGQAVEKVEKHVGRTPRAAKSRIPPPPARGTPGAALVLSPLIFGPLAAFERDSVSAAVAIPLAGTCAVAGGVAFLVFGERSAGALLFGAVAGADIALLSLLTAGVATTLLQALLGFLGESAEVSPLDWRRLALVLSVCLGCSGAAGGAILVALARRERSPAAGDFAGDRSLARGRAGGGGPALQVVVPRSGTGTTLVLALIHRFAARKHPRAAR